MKKEKTNMKAGYSVECIHKNLVFTETEPRYMGFLAVELDDIGIEYSIVELPLGGNALYVEMDNPRNDELIQEAGYEVSNLKTWLRRQLENEKIYEFVLEADSNDKVAGWRGSYEKWE
jgi:hypothetical protein